MGKIISKEKLKKELSLLRKKGKKIVCANGCFDLIHVGHIRYLQGAKKKGDILVVAMNSDSSVKKIKGPKRPILTEKERSHIVAGMYMVDYVVLFSEKTADTILKIIKPDVHAKGTDYTKDTVPEKGLLHRYVGEIAIVGDQKKHATRDMISMIYNKYSRKAVGYKP